ncbi:type II toxin-antitoxin system VapC family toxin [Nostoc sp. WHI]|uniref:type II toxin-antitoxin system VapC family toxin n=1 Tax=Nostoc sp. WHI TaxID=2650611 RepID=UPI0018C602C8|nr:type II toxin-antitoxin system VapC family toxin [Nostoc sp. WHI]MBG1269822.1 type II toxin-antitoxin system VapC family toxin [Nostoc sp. WHI]
MIAVDTNIIVRFLTQDDELQFQKSREIFQTQDIFITDTVILETEWVLRFAYKLKPDEICTTLKNLFGLPNIYLSNPSLIVQVIQWHENGLDFADAFHLAQSQHCSKFYTFDEKFVKKAKGLTQCEVKKPLI